MLNLNIIRFSKFVTSSLINTSGMFSGCNSIYQLNLVKFDTSKVIDMSYMFQDFKIINKITSTKHSTCIY